MDTLMQADIFFFVTTIVAVIIAIFIAILIYYLIKVVKNVHSITDNVKAISETVKAESVNIVDDLAALRMKFKQDASSMNGFGGLIRKVFAGAAFIRKATKKAGKKTSESESK